MLGAHIRHEQHLALPEGERDAARMADHLSEQERRQSAAGRDAGGDEADQQHRQYHPKDDPVKSRLRHRPIRAAVYQPDVAADTILYADEHPRREFYVHVLAQVLSRCRRLVGGTVAAAVGVAALWLAHDALAQDSQQ
jgi:hypothetical protein